MHGTASSNGASREPTRTPRPLGLRRATQAAPSPPAGRSLSSPTPSACLWLVCREAGRRTTAQRALNAALAAKRDALDTVSEAAKALEAAEAALEARAGARADAQQGLAAAATRRAAAAARLHAAQNDLAEAVGAALETLQAAEVAAVEEPACPRVLREDSWW